MRNKKILVVHSSNDSYGASKIFIQLLELLHNNYELFVVLPSNGPLDRYLEKIKVKTYYYNLGVLRKKYLNFFGLINRFYRIIRSLFFLSNLINKNKIDLVYTNTSVIWSSGIAAKLCGIQSVYHIHEIPYGSKLYVSISRSLIYFVSNKIICVSDSVLNHWNKDFNSSKIVKIYNGIVCSELQTKKKDNKELIFTNISRISPYKGHKYLLKIAKILISKKIKFKFQIIGDCAPGYEKYEQEIKEIIKRNGLENYVFFLGFKKNALEYLKSSNFLIHTAVMPDPLPTVIFESLLVNTPVISTNLGGAVEILDNGNCGLLIPVDDPKKSSSLISQYIQDIELQKKHLGDFKNLYKKKFRVEIFEKQIISQIEKT